MDKKLRELERKAAGGDIEAESRLQKERCRIGQHATKEETEISYSLSRPPNKYTLLTINSQKIVTCDQCNWCDRKGLKISKSEVYRMPLEYAFPLGLIQPSPLDQKRLKEEAAIIGFDFYYPIKWVREGTFPVSYIKQWDDLMKLSSGFSIFDLEMSFALYSNPALYNMVEKSVRRMVAN